MFKKTLYALVIVTMIVAAFGMRGAGVQKAAAVSYTFLDDNFGSVVTLPYHAGDWDWATDMTAQPGIDVGTIVGAHVCYADVSADTAWEKVTTDPNAHFMHLAAWTEFNAVIAIFQDMGGALGPAVDCIYSGAPNPVTGKALIDLVLPANPNTSYHVFIAPSLGGGGAVVGDDLELWIAEFRYGGGMIINVCEKNILSADSDCNSWGEEITNATALLQPKAGGAVIDSDTGYGVWVSDVNGDLFLDVPDGNYYVGVSSTFDGSAPVSIDALWFVDPPSPGIFFLDPGDAGGFVSLAGDHVFRGISGVNLDADVYVTPTGGVLPSIELPLRTAAGGTLPDFKIFPADRKSTRLNSSHDV